MYDGSNESGFMKALHHYKSSVTVQEEGERCNFRLHTDGNDGLWSDLLHKNLTS